MDEKGKMATEEEDEDEVMQLAERLAGAKMQTSGARGEMKATRERILAYMLATEQKELKIGGVKFSVQEKPAPMKMADLFWETLRRHYGFKEPDWDELMELLAHTKDEMATMRNVLSIRAARRTKPPSHDDGDDSQQMAAAEEDAGGEAEQKDEPKPGARQAVRPAPGGGPMALSDQATAPVSFYDSVSVALGRPAVEEPPAPPIFSTHELSELRTAPPNAHSTPPAPSQQQYQRTQQRVSPRQRLGATAAPTKPAESKQPRMARTDPIYDEAMDIEFALDGREAPDPASALYMGPLPRIMQNLIAQPTPPPA